MKMCGVGVLVLILAVGVLPAQALEPLALYDDFNTPRLNPTKWTGSEDGTNYFTLPYGRNGGGLLETIREIHGNRLHLSARYSASPFSDIGLGFGGRLRLAFTNPSLVTAIEATLHVRAVEAIGCPTHPGDLSRAQARVGGYFFNTQGPPYNGNLNDVFATVRLLRSSDSTDAPNVLHVVGRVFLCKDSGCNSTITLGDPDLGTVLIGEVVRLRVQWDPANHRFLFQRDQEPEVDVGYTVPDSYASVSPAKRIDIAHEAPNCTSADAHAYMEIYADDVFVNESAVLSP